MDVRRLAVSGENQAAAAMCVEILGNGGNPSFQRASDVVTRD